MSASEMCLPGRPACAAARKCSGCSTRTSSSGRKRSPFRHRIPVRGNGTAGRQHTAETDTEGDHALAYPSRWGRDDAPCGVPVQVSSRSPSSASRRAGANPKCRTQPCYGRASLSRVAWPPTRISRPAHVGGSQIRDDVLIGGRVTGCASGRRGRSWPRKRRTYRAPRRQAEWRTNKGRRQAVRSGTDSTA